MIIQVNDVAGVSVHLMWTGLIHGFTRENTATGTAEQHELGLKSLQQRPACESHADTTQFVRIRTVSVASRRLRVPVIAAAG